MPVAIPPRIVPLALVSALTSACLLTPNEWMQVDDRETEIDFYGVVHTSAASIRLEAFDADGLDWVELATIPVESEPVGKPFVDAELYPFSTSIAIPEKFWTVGGCTGWQTAVRATQVSENFEPHLLTFGQDWEECLMDSGDHLGTFVAHCASPNAPVIRISTSDLAPAPPIEILAGPDVDFGSCEGEGPILVTARITPGRHADLALAWGTGTTIVEAALCGDGSESDGWITCEIPVGPGHTFTSMADAWAQRSMLALEIRGHDYGCETGYVPIAYSEIVHAAHVDGDEASCGSSTKPSPVTAWSIGCVCAVPTLEGKDVVYDYSEVEVTACLESDLSEPLSAGALICGYVQRDARTITGLAVDCVLDAIADTGEERPECFPGSYVIDEVIEL